MKLGRSLVVLIATLAFTAVAVASAQAESIRTLNFTATGFQLVSGDPLGLLGLSSVPEVTGTVVFDEDATPPPSLVQRR